MSEYIEQNSAWNAPMEFRLFIFFKNKNDPISITIGYINVLILHSLFIMKTRHTGFKTIVKLYKFLNI